MTFERIDFSDDVTLYRGDCIEVLPALPEASVHCVVTSPPYFGLRDYGTAQWEGGDAECDHREDDHRNRREKGLFHGGDDSAQTHPFRSVCPKCGAIRVDNQIGLEETPEAYVEKLVAVFREVRRVLRDDGTVWLNLGDSYAANRSYQVPDNKHCDVGNNAGSNVPPGLKPKDLLGIPWRVAFALQADGWYLRQDIIWAKPNPMPESVTDRCTKAHEYVFLLTKSASYWYDNEAVKEKAALDSIARQRRGVSADHKNTNGAPGQPPHTLSQERQNDKNREVDATRNRRSVWTVATTPYSGAHFATFPPKLIEPMILAGCPELCCPVCGKGWKRVVETTPNKPRVRKPLGKGSAYHSSIAGPQQQNEHGNDLGVTTRTLGFRPTCACGATDSVPGVVLDPFGGSGTTAEVAVKHGRKAILIDLNGEYVELQRERLRDIVAQPPLFRAEQLAAEPQQQALFEA